MSGVHLVQSHLTHSIFTFTQFFSTNSFASSTCSTCITALSQSTSILTLFAL